MYRVRNPIEALRGLNSLAKGHSPRIQKEPQKGSFPTERTFSNLESYKRENSVRRGTLKYKD
jgi:hypothetical protein